MTEGVDVLAEGIQLGFHAGEQVPAHDDGEAVVGYALEDGFRVHAYLHNFKGHPLTGLELGQRGGSPAA